MAEFSDYIEQAGRRYVGALDGSELMAGSRGGISKSWSTQQVADLAFGNIVEGDVPTGDIDGVNDTFTLTYNPLAASVKVYHNGLRTSAFTVDGQNIIMTVPPEIGDTLLSDYRV